MTEEGEVWWWGNGIYGVPHRFEGLKREGLEKYVVTAAMGETQVMVSIDETRLEKEPLKRSIKFPLPLEKMLEHRRKWIEENGYHLELDKTE